jgi:hypothetical protein
MLKLASFYFGWELDNIRTRLIFYTILDVEGRNIQPFGESHVRYPRWVELGYENELMRLTDFINSLPLVRREELILVTRIKPIRPSEELVADLWELAKGQMPIKSFHYKYVGVLGSA